MPGTIGGPERHYGVDERTAPSPTVAPGVAIVTDSTACLAAELVQRYGIAVAPVNLIIDGKTYRDGIDIRPREFYQRLQRSRKLPTTAPSSPGFYLELFRQASQGQRPVLCITASVALSGMHDSASIAARMAKDEMPGVRVAILDSGTAAMAQGFVVLEAARAAAEGCDLETVIARAEAVKPAVRLIAMIDTLYYLAKGGRVPRAAAWATYLLQIKPIIELLPGGEVNLVQRIRTKSKAVERLLGLVQAAAGGQAIHAAVVHTDAPEEAAQLQARLAAHQPCAELHLSEFTPVMGAHTGPGLLGIAFYPQSNGEGARRRP